MPRVSGWLRARCVFYIIAESLQSQVVHRDRARFLNSGMITMISATISTQVVLSSSAVSSSRRALLQTNTSTLSPLVSACGSQVSSTAMTVASGGGLVVDTSCSYGTETWNVEGTSATYQVTLVVV